MKEWIGKLKNRVLNEFNQKPIKKVCNTMDVLDESIIPMDYLVLRIDGQTFSTNSKEINTGKLQLVLTKHIGHQNNIWIRGKFTEKENHELLEKETPFEINIYTKCIVEK
jgi:hypothetical protein